MQIPIENIYYLLCYAWNKLDEKDRVGVSIDGNTQLLDLFGKVLMNGTRILLKRGIEKYYVAETCDLPGIKGKFEITATLKSGTLLKQRTICTFDEFSGNILSNQILVTTLYQLLKTQDLDTDIRAKIKNLLRMFPNINLIELKGKLFREVKIHRNNQFYGFLLNVCQILYEHSMPSETKGEWKFMDFTRDEHKMNQLFEKFILNFYKLEFPQWSVSSPHIKWQFESKSDTDQQYIPSMRTDICIENAKTKIIMDAKYYREMMSSYYGTEKVKSGNLYQLFSYLLNQQDGSEKSNNAKGILVYPTIDEEYNLEYKYENHPIQLKTINLNQHWTKIEERLKDIVSVFDSSS